MKDILLTTYRGAKEILLVIGTCCIAWGTLYSLGWIFSWVIDNLGETTFYSIVGVMAFLSISYIIGLHRGRG